MRTLLLLTATLLIVCLSACRTDFEFTRQTGGLQFSRDTVYLDTVFSNIGSSTYTLKVYNKSNRNIAIPTVKLGKGDLSKYRITVDGMTGEDTDGDGIGNGKTFTDVELLAKDSLFIFIETTAAITDANPTDFLYTDQIQFGLGDNMQKVELVTLIQDATFLFPKRFGDGTTERLIVGQDTIYGFVLDENDPIHGNEYIMTNEKPYVIYGYAAVAGGKTLEVQAGARLHFHEQSGIIVANEASLKILGTESFTDQMENEVVFEGDRLEPSFANVPGQWGTIWLTSGSTGHDIRHLTIKNAIIGLRVENNTSVMNIENTRIFDCSNFGLYAVNAKINARNLVINNAGERALQCLYGGTYDFTHCTFNNDWGRSSYSVFVNNFIDGAEPRSMPLDIQFKNSIIFGSNQVQLNMQRDEASAFEYKFTNCLIKFNDINNNFRNNPLFDFTDSQRYENCLISRSGSSVFNPQFLNADKNMLNIGDNSAAKGKANFTFSSGTSDINHRIRTEPSDIGAYNAEVFED